MRAMDVFDTEVHPRLEKARLLHKILRPSSKSLEGTECIVLQHGDPSVDAVREPIVIEVDRFVEMFSEPLATRRFSVSDFEQHCRKANLEWASVIVDRLFKALGERAT